MRKYWIVGVCVLVAGWVLSLPASSAGAARPVGQAPAQLVTCGGLVGVSASWGGGGFSYNNYPVSDVFDNSFATFMAIGNQVANSTYIQFQAPGRLIGLSVYQSAYNQTSYSDVFGSYDGTTWVQILNDVYLNRANLWHFGGVKDYTHYKVVWVIEGAYYRFERIDATDQYGNGCSYPPDYGIPTNTPGPGGTNTPPPQPTNTPVPTATNTPYPLQGTPVQGHCGGPGQPPCHVYWLTPGPVIVTGTVGVQIHGTVVISGQVGITGTVSVNVNNWPTPIPSATPPGGAAARDTAVAIANGTAVAGGEPPPGAAGSQGLVYSPYGDTTFIGWTEHDYGCPVTVPIVDLTLCFTYKEINALNLGPIAVPTWPFVAALAVVVLGMVKNR
jgi:hypothetical protein